MESSLVDSTRSLAPTLVSLKSVVTVDGQDCELTPIDVNTAERDFTALQYALFISLFVQVKITIVELFEQNCNMFISNLGHWSFCIHRHFVVNC